MSVLEVFTGIINQSLSEPHAGLLLGILFGTKATLSREFMQALITTGTIHIVALSGMNITLLITFSQLFLLRVLRRPIANIAAVLFIIGFIYVVGPSVSVIRAAIMGCISLLAVNFGRKNIPIFTLIVAVSCMLLLNPLWAVDLSFQLSVFATLGIILFAKKAGETSQKNPFYALIEDDLRVTLSAQVFTIPIILFHFHRISLIAPLSNILIGWLIGPVMIIGFIMIAVGLVWLPLAQIVGWIAWVILSAIIMAIELTARIPFASVGF